MERILNHILSSIKEIDLKDGDEILFINYQTLQEPKREVKKQPQKDAHEDGITLEKLINPESRSIQLIHLLRLLKEKIYLFKVSLRINILKMMDFDTLKPK